jgi:hypothetical protein
MDGRRARASGRHIEVTRTVRLGAAAFADALVGLRREMTGLDHRFHLGDRGTFELDARLSPPGPSSLGRAELNGRLWNPSGDSVVPVRIRATSDDGVTIVALLPSRDIADWFADHLAEYLDLAHAALDELCEELLYHAAVERRARETR